VRLWSSKVGAATGTKAVLLVVVVVVVVLLLVVELLERFHIWYRETTPLPKTPTHSPTP